VALDVGEEFFVEFGVGLSAMKERKE